MSIRSPADDCPPRPALLLLPSRPLVMLAAAFATGIVLGNSPYCVVALWAAAGGSCAAWAFARRQILGTSAILCGCAAVGAICQLAASTVDGDDVSRVADGALATVEGVVASEPEIHGRTVSLIVTADHVVVGGSMRECSGQVSCTL